MRSPKVLAALAVVIIAVIAAAYFLTDREDPNVLKASGTIEATDVDISFQVPGRVSEMLAVEGMAVMQGDVLARLSAEELSERVNQIQASLDATASQVRQQESMVELRSGVIGSQVEQARSQTEASRIAAERVREGPRPQEIRVAEAELKESEAALTQRRADFERAQGLLQEGIIPKQQFDSVEAALRAAETRREAASQRLELAREGSRREDIEEAEARLRAAQAGLGIAESGLKEVDVQREALGAARARERELRAQLEAARVQLAYAEIRSPLNGVVLTRNVETGEFVSAGTPVVTIADVEALWMNIYVPETQTGLVKLGQTVRVRVDSFPDETFNGKVTFVSAESEFTPKTILTQEERIKLVYRVKVALENVGQRLKPGMPADAEIDLQ